MQGAGATKEIGSVACGVRHGSTVSVSCITCYCVVRICLLQSPAVSFPPAKSMNVKEFLDELMINLEPIGDRIAVLPDEDARISSGGILIPETEEKEPKQVGTVIALASNRLSYGLLEGGTLLTAGDRVLFGKYSGDDVSVYKKNGESVKIKILHSDSILSRCNSKYDRI
jgi:chaperonin GroES